MSKLCVYCNKSNDFNGEHVFPASLGGDDRRYMLTDCVCSYCNSKFSELELELARRSPIALGRIGNQENSRDRGSKPNPPKMEVRSSYILDLENNQLLEVVVGAKFSSEIVPQAIIHDEKVNYTADDAKKLDLFISKAKILIKSETMTTVKKNGSENYEVISYKRINGKYVLSEQSTELRAPKVSALWIASVSESTGGSEFSTIPIHPRFVLHGGKSINYKALNTSDLCSDLDKFYNFISHYTGDNPKEGEIQNPLVKVSMSFDMPKMLRAMVKIGLNLLTFCAGANYLRHEAFQKAKAFVLDGDVGVRMQVVGADDSLESLMGEKIEGAHTMFLFPLDKGDGTFLIAFMIRFYGGQTFFFALSEDAPDPDIGVLPLYYNVYYNQNKIEKVYAMDHLQGRESSLTNL